MLILSHPDVAVRPEAALVLDAAGRVLDASPAAGSLFGADPTGRELGELVTDPAPLWRARDAASAVPLEGRRRNGVPFALDASVRALAGGGRLCVLHEVDRQAPGTLDAAFDAMPIGMALFNTDGEYLRVNAALCALLGRRGEDLLGRRDQELTHPDDRQSDLDAAWRILRGELSTWQCEKRFVRPDQTIVWTAAHLTFLRDGHGRPLCWVGQFTDITELRRQASRDPLTDALNRRAFDVELERACDASLVILDLDGFKEINDAHGHHAGDELLRGIAEAVGGRLRRGDSLARLGGDEFAVLLPHCDPQQAVLVANDLAALIAAQRFVFDGVERHVTASVGVTAVTGEGSLFAADRAMYAAKAAGGDRVRRAH
jgi:diguanylate cyclase (GGDEF)-like protein/PAS domain S-box-containing protein